VSTWFGLDSEIVEPLEERYFTVTIPVYGSPPSFFNKISNGNGLSELTELRPERLVKQLAALSTKSVVHATAEELIEWFLLKTALGQARGYSLVANGVGLYEFRRGNYVSDLESKAKRIGVGFELEIGYPSVRADAEGLIERRIVAYAGTVHSVRANFITVKLGNGIYRNFSLAKMAWFSVVSERDLEQGHFHHEFIKIGLARGVRDRLHMKVTALTGDDALTHIRSLGHFDLEEDEKLEALAAIAQRERKAWLLMEELRESLTNGMSELGMEANDEFTKLDSHLVRLRDSYGNSKD